MNKQEAALSDEYQDATKKRMLESIAELMHENASLKDDKERLRAELSAYKELDRAYKREVAQLKQWLAKGVAKKTDTEKFIDTYNMLIGHGLTQMQIADEIGVKQPRISAIIKPPSPSIDNLAGIVGLAVREGLISAKG